MTSDVFLVEGGHLCQSVLGNTLRTFLSMETLKLSVSLHRTSVISKLQR